MKPNAESKVLERLSAGRAAQAVAIACCLFLLVFLVGCSCSPEEEKKKDEPKKEETVAVPDVVGMTKEDAQRVIKDNGFTVGTVSEEASETVAAGNVISQNPKEKSQAKAAATINLVVSKGSTKPPAQVTVPELSGMTQTQAEEVLLALKLVPLPEDPVYADGVAPGKVFKQSSAAGTAVDVGTTIRFTVALGTEVAAVPSVVGLTKDAAVKALADAGFGADIVVQYNESIEEGKVITQNPYPKLQVVKGTTVTLVVSQGATPTGKVEVPDLSAMTLAQAVQVCNSAGLVLVPTGDDLNGNIVSQTPVAGTMVEKGSKISATFEAFKPVS